MRCVESVLAGYSVMPLIDPGEAGEQGEAARLHRLSDKELIILQMLAKGIELIRARVSSTKSDLAALRAAGDDVGTIRAVADRLKSSAHFIDRQSYRALAQRLETAARGEDRRIVTALVQIFIPTTENLYALLKGNLPA